MHGLLRSGTYSLALLICLACGVQVLAQAPQRGNYNYREHQSKDYYFGITLGYNTSSYKLFYSDEFVAENGILGTKVNREPGLDLKIVSNLKVGEYIDVRFLPGLAFAGRSIDYSYGQNQPPQQRKISSVFAEFPVQVRYKSEPWKDIRLFVLGGVKYSYDVASDSKTTDEDLVRFSPSDFQLEVGAGMQFYFPYFIFSPEVKFSHGLGNVLLFDDSVDRSSVLDKVLSRVFTFSLHFEG